MKIWLQSSLQRIFVRSKPRSNHPLILHGACGERLSFQAGVYNETGQAREIRLQASAPDDLSVQIRRVGHVTLPHRNTNMPPAETDGIGMLPGFAPDPLFPDSTLLLGPEESGSFWITIRVSPEAIPGSKHIILTLCDGKGSKAKLTATVAVGCTAIQPRGDFRISHWFYCDAIADWYGVEPFDARFWPICANYMCDFAEHGNDVILTPVFTPPTDGVKRPTQLLRINRDAGGRYGFGWGRVKRFIDLAKQCGLTHFAFPHFFTQWGCEFAIRIYEKKGGKDTLLWAPKTRATSNTYRAFLSQYLPSLQRFLVEEKIADKSFFSVSDEPHGEKHLRNYRAARQMLRELAPWMKVGDALSDMRYAQERLTDLPVPSITHAKRFIEAGIPCWTYFAGNPRGLYINRCIDTPLWKLRMLGWVCYRLGLGGFLHWAYNSWYRLLTRDLIDPFAVTDGGLWSFLPYGNSFVVYPGADGRPIDSVRWEVFAESFQDMALLQTLGISREDRMLSSIRDFNEFPRDPYWILKTRKRLLSR